MFTAFIAIHFIEAPCNSCRILSGRAVMVDFRYWEGEAALWNVGQHGTAENRTLGRL
jgi:hypothetical protein